MIYIDYTWVFLSNLKVTSIKPPLFVNLISWTIFETRESVDIIPEIKAPTNPIV